MSLESIDMVKAIGEGNYAIVYSGKMRTAEGEWIPAAIKKQTSRAISNQDRESFVAEAKILLRLRHPNVVQIYGVCADTERLLIVMELCTGGSLASHLQKMANRLNLDVKLGYCYDTAKGMTYLHAKQIIHRDLAARNCLLGSSGNVKISDFGLSKEGAYKLAQGVATILPLRWSAPEVLLEGKCTDKSDVFSYAVLLWEIFTDAKLPWEDLRNPREVVKALKQGQRLKFPANTPQPIKTMAEECFRKDPLERPTFKLICAQLSLLTNRCDHSNSSSRCSTISTKIR